MIVVAEWGCAVVGVVVDGMVEDVDVLQVDGRDAAEERLEDERSGGEGEVVAETDRMAVLFVIHRRLREGEGVT